MFTEEERERLRSSLLEVAARDQRLSGIAITGSGASGLLDRWSDIDLAFGVGPVASVADVLEDWTARMYAEHRALHHVDVRAGSWIYRVFLLSNTLQVDLAFVQAQDFQALAPTFRLVSGEAKEAESFPAPSIANLIGMGWLYALHARSSIARGKLWQAEYMISGLRNHALALACVRHGLTTAHNKGVDQLPHQVLSRFEGALVTSLDRDELVRASRIAMERLLEEIQIADAKLRERLDGALVELAETTQ